MKVFISHRRMDAAWAERLATDLRNAGIYAWLDIWDMPPGKALTDAMQDGIEESDAILLVLTPEFVDSVNSGAGGVAFEVHIAEERRLRSKDFRMIGLLREPCDPPGKLRNRLGRQLDFTRDDQYAARLGELVAWLTGRPLGPAVAKPGESPVEIFPSFPADEVYTGIARAQHSIIVLSTWVYGIRTLTNSVSESVLEQDCRARMLLLDPASDEAKQRALALGYAPDHGAMLLESNLEVLRACGDTHARFRDRVQVRLYSSPPSLLIFGWDETLIFSNLFSSQESTFTPKFRVVGSAAPMHRDLMREFEHIWTRSIPR
jgi:hypothetical protein